MFVEFFTIFLQSTCFTSIIGFTKFLLKNSGTDISCVIITISCFSLDLWYRHDIITENNPIILENCSLCKSKKYVDRSTLHRRYSRSNAMLESSTMNVYPTIVCTLIKPSRLSRRPHGSPRLTSGLCRNLDHWLRRIIIEQLLLLSQF